MPKITKNFFVLVATLALFLVLTGVTANQSPIKAATDPDPAALKIWVTECQRRNILNGCACKCEQKVTKNIIYGEFNVLDQSSPILSVAYIPDSLNGQYLRCPVKVNSLEKDKCIEGYTDSTPEENRITTGFVLFPKLDNGIIELDSTGQIQLGKSLRNIGSLLFGVIGLISVGFGIFGTVTISLAGGEEKKAELGRMILKNAIIGLLVSIGSLILIGILFSLLSVNTDLNTIDSKLSPTPTASLDSDFLRKLFGL